jgi:hypothetical protein
MKVAQWWLDGGLWWLGGGPALLESCPTVGQWPVVLMLS